MIAAPVWAARKARPNMRKIFARWSVPCAIFLLAIGGSARTASAQPVPWHIDQGSDGTLYLVTGDTHYVVNPDAISDDRLAALIDGGVLGSQLPLQSAPAVVVAPAVPLPVVAEPTATLTPVPATPAPAATTAAQSPVLGSREQPIPLGTGQGIAVSDGWSYGVVSVTQNATSQVLAKNQFNKPPVAGQQFFIARISATYAGAVSHSFGASFRLRAVGATAVSYSIFQNGCGVIPDPISDNEVFTSGTVVGNVCWAIQSADASSLVMYDESVVSADRHYLALH
jgi:hypothetical protein